MSAFSLPDDDQGLCPACGYDLGAPIWNGLIPSLITCPSCGITFGRDDADRTDIVTRSRVWTREDPNYREVVRMPTTKYPTRQSFADITYLQWRQGWIEERLPWRGKTEPLPPGWDPVVQLKIVGENLGESHTAWIASLPPPATLDELPAWREWARKQEERLRVRALPVAAIEALWDGDTYGWGVDLAAILIAPSDDHPRYTETHLAFIRAVGGDYRLFVGAVPPWPEARIAMEVGTILAETFGVPLFFPSPDKPIAETGRWWNIDIDAALKAQKDANAENDDV